MFKDNKRCNRVSSRLLIGNFIAILPIGVALELHWGCTAALMTSATPV